MTERPVCRGDDVAPGTAHRVVVPTVDGASVPVAIVRTAEGDLFAIGDLCSHEDVSLSEGDVVGRTIECYAHGSRFDLCTGNPLGLPAMEPVPAYPVRVEGDHILVDVDAPILNLKETA